MSSESKETCPICWTRWGKSLWKDHCACNGEVNLIFRAPGKLDFNPEPWELPEDKVKKVETKAQKKKGSQS